MHTDRRAANIKTCTLLTSVLFAAMLADGAAAAILAPVALAAVLAGAGAAASMAQRLAYFVLAHVPAREGRCRFRKLSDRRRARTWRMCHYTHACT